MRFSPKFITRSSPTVTLVRNGPLNTACRTLIEESSGCEDDQAALQGAENRSCLAQVMRSGTVGLGPVPVAVDAARTVACRVMRVVDNAINHSTYVLAKLADDAPAGELISPKMHAAAAADLHSGYPRPASLVQVF